MLSSLQLYSQQFELPALTSGSLNTCTLRLQVGQTNIERRAHRAEKFAARKTLVPVLQAEEDRR
jgi:hypothetical protein